MKVFATELLVLAMYGELLRPSQPVRFLIPYSSLLELYMLTEDPLELDADDSGEQAEMLAAVHKLLGFLENSFVRKKIDRVLKVPWAISQPIIYHESVTFQFVNSDDTAAFGEDFDPIETELIEIAAREEVPLLIEDPSIHQRIVELGIPIQVYDVADFEFALEETDTDAFHTQTLPDKGSSLIPFILFGGTLLVLIVTILTTFI